MSGAERIDDRERKPPGARALLVTWLALMALAAASLALSFAPLGAWGIAVAMSIALGKAALVAIVFMELAVHRFTVRMVLAVVVVFIALLVGFMVADVTTRTVVPLEVPRGNA
jgi:cytochrome c oxidase subunit 4